MSMKLYTTFKLIKVIGQRIRDILENSSLENSGRFKLLIEAYAEITTMVTISQ